MNQDLVHQRLLASFEALYYYDQILLEYDVSERTITALLARYLFGLFPFYNVDVEYNRHKIKSQKLQLGKEGKNNGETLILPDIIIHKRGNDEKNLVVIELKKTTNTEPRDFYYAKLSA